MLYTVRYFLLVFIRVFQWVMVATAIVSWIPSLRDSKIGYFLYSCTEPIIRPVRDLIYRIPGADNLPIDLSFLAVYILLSVIESIIL